MPDQDRVALAKERLARYLAGEMDDPGYEPEDLLMFDVWVLEKEDLGWLTMEVTRAQKWRGADRRLGRQVEGLMRDMASRGKLAQVLDALEVDPADDRTPPRLTLEGEALRLRATVVFLARVGRIDVHESGTASDHVSVRLAPLESFLPTAGAEMPRECVVLYAFADARHEDTARRLSFGAEVIVFSAGFTGGAWSMLVPPPSLPVQVRAAMEFVEGIRPVHRKMMSNRGTDVTDARLDEQRRLYKRILQCLGQRHAPTAGGG